MTAPDPKGPTDSDVHCPECDYNLTGLTECRCPWCGWVVDERLLITIERDRSNVRRIGAILACFACGIGSPVVVAAMVRHGSHLSLRDALASVGVLIASVGHVGLAGLMMSDPKHWPLYRKDGGALFRFAGWFSIVLGVIGATELLRSRVVYGIPMAATFEFALAVVFYSLPGIALLVMRMVSFRDAADVRAASTRTDHLVQTRASDCPFTIDFVGTFKKEQVATLWTDEPALTSPDVDAEIDRAWSAAKSRAESEKTVLFDGPLVALREVALHAGGLKLILGATTYRAFFGTNLNAAVVAEKSARPFLASALGISAAVCTSDGFVAMGRRSLRVAYHAGFVHPFGGMVEPSDRTRDGTVDLFGAMIRELDEELGLRPNDVGDLSILGLVRDVSLLQPELVFRAYVRLSRQELERMFDFIRGNDEHSRFEFLYDDPDATMPSLDRLDKITPVGEATYLLHGRSCWGAEWFDQACLLRYGGLPERTANPPPQ